MTANKTNREGIKMKSPAFNLILCQILNAMAWIVLRLMSANDVYLQYNNLPQNLLTTDNAPNISDSGHANQK